MSLDYCGTIWASTNLSKKRDSPSKGGTPLPPQQTKPKDVLLLPRSNPITAEALGSRRKAGAIRPIPLARHNIYFFGLALSLCLLFFSCFHAPLLADGSKDSPNCCSSVRQHHPCVLPYIPFTLFERFESDESLQCPRLRVRCRSD